MTLIMRACQKLLFKKKYVIVESEAEKVSGKSLGTTTVVQNLR